MKSRIFFYTVAFIMLSFPAIGQEPTPEAETFFQKAMTQINAKHTSWIKKTALEVNDKNRTTDEVNSLAKNYGKLSGLNDMDIMAMAFLVMMQASKSAQEDLKAIMAEVKAINGQKKEIREALNDLNNKNTNVTRVQMDSFKLVIKRSKAIRQNKKILNPASSSISSADRNVSPKEISVVKDQLNMEYNSTNEMSEMQTVKLQMAMDRRSKMISTVSNLMKKISDSQQSIIQNLK